MDILLIILFGLVIGSFCNVLIDRLPKGETVLWGRSHCDHCKKTLRWFELIPVISFILQGGVCRRCKKKLSIQYPVIELISACLLVSLYTVYSSTIFLFVAYSIIAYSFLVIFVADVKEQIIPDSMLVTGLLGIAVMYYAQGIGLPQLGIYVWSAVCACAFFFLLWLITKGRGMGLGDVKLAFVLGLFLGFPRIVIALYIGFLTGACVGVILILLGNKTLKSKIAFGPFLLFGASIAFVWGDVVLKLWRNLL
jgi:leader peptidase (prepilin peptidase) / N-methyltransferase